MCVRACVRVCVKTRMPLYLHVCRYRFIYRLYKHCLRNSRLLPRKMWFFVKSLKHFPSRRRNYSPLLIHYISPAQFVGGLRKLFVKCIKDQTVCRARYPRARRGSEKLQCVYASADCVRSRMPLLWPSRVLLKQSSRFKWPSFVAAQGEISVYFEWKISCKSFPASESVSFRNSMRRHDRLCGRGGYAPLTITEHCGRGNATAASFC